MSPVIIAGVAAVIAIGVVAFVMMKKKAGLRGQYKVDEDNWNGTSKGYYYTYDPDNMKMLTHKPDKSYHASKDILKVSDDKNTITVDIYDHTLEDTGSVRMTANNGKYEGKHWILKKSNEALAAAQAAFGI